MPKDKIEIRIDDVLLHQDLTVVMQKALEKGSWFEQFKEFDKFFEENNIMTVLAICTDGINQYPEWVEYIKKNLYRYHIALHGHKHMNYRNRSLEFGLKYLAKAKRKLEKTFGVNVAKFYPPFAIRGLPKWGDELRQIGLDCNKAYDESKHHYRSHYWNPKDVKRIKGICKYYYHLE